MGSMQMAEAMQDYGLPELCGFVVVVVAQCLLL